MRAIDANKTDKQILYEKYVFDSLGRVRLYHPVTNLILMEVLEANGLEEKLKAYDEERESKKRTHCVEISTD